MMKIGSRCDNMSVVIIGGGKKRKMVFFLHGFVMLLNIESKLVVSKLILTLLMLYYNGWIKQHNHNIRSVKIRRKKTIL